MKVLFVSNECEFGGAPKCMMELVEQLIQKGVSIEILTTGTNKTAKFCEDRNIRYYPVGHVSFAIGRGSTPIRCLAKTILTPYYYLRSCLKNERAFQKACELIDFSDIDIIHTNSNRDCLGAMLAKEYGIPHFWHLREFGKEDYNIRYLMFNHINFMNSTTSYFIAISDAVKNAWIRRGLKKNKVIRIYDGITLPRTDIVAKADAFKQRTDREDFRFAYLGIVCPGKGQFDAVRALVYIEPDVVKRIHIDFWGDCECLPEFTNQIKKFAKSKAILNSISFKGFTNNIWDELPNYDGALVCSRSEAFGRITPEYMSMGLQVIASDSGSNPELVEDGVSGYIYKHDDLTDLAAKIEMLCSKTTEERANMVCKAKERAGQFTDVIHAEKIYSLYKEVAAFSKKIAR